MNNCPELQQMMEGSGYTMDQLANHQRHCPTCKTSEGNIAPHREHTYTSQPPELDDFPYPDRSLPSDLLHCGD